MNSAEWPSDGTVAALSLAGVETVEESQTFIDVGAHRGETLEQILSMARIASTYLAFEPNPRSFQPLVERSRHFPGHSVTCFPEAVGPTDGEVEFTATRATAVSGILQAEPELLIRVPSGDHEPIARFTVPQRSIDSLRERLSIDTIAILKTDTEGYDLQVLKGASKTLAERKVDVVMSEAFFVRYRQGQSYFWDLANFMQSNGYFFVNLFDHRNTRQGRLYTANAIWVSPQTAEKQGFL
jgi:FkbM family methyltransferase